MPAQAVVWAGVFSVKERKAGMSGMQNMNNHG